MQRASKLTATDDDLRLGRGVRGPLHARLGSPIEDARYPVRLGEQRAVAEAEREAEPDAEHGAREHVRLRQDRNGHQIAHEYPGQQQIAQLSPRCHDHRCTVKKNKSTLI